MKAQTNEVKTANEIGIKEILLGLFVNGKDLANEVNAAIDAAYKEK